MQEAIKEAYKAYEADEIPVGAVVVVNNKIIGKGYNLTECLHDVSAHAEMQALTAAANYLGSKYLQDCTLYVTIEPCVMCAGAAYWFQIAKLVFGAKDAKRGFSIWSKRIIHPRTSIRGGVCASECAALMQTFLCQKRKCP